MFAISEKDIRRRIERDNPWWATGIDQIPEAKFPKRLYFKSFKDLAISFEVRRAIVLLGPRRVGKTVMLKQLVSEMIQSGFDAQAILYASIDTPIYSGIPLEKIMDLMAIKDGAAKRVVIFDEIQYLPNWELHLKDLVDSYPNIKFIASGSAAAALRLKSQESGAGRFSEFMLPPLTFYEFLCFAGRHDDLIEKVDEKTYKTLDINALNTSFIDYLNYGGYPEAVLNEQIRQYPEQFIKADIIDKVLLKDLPSLYGINEIQELNKLFSFLAYNTGNEASLERIAQQSGLAKPTIKKYIEYLQSAFLILKLTTVDDNCRKIQRERQFKIYLNNPSMRAALFAPVTAEDSTLVGQLTESAIFSQWQHGNTMNRLRYARWRNEGEVDIVYLSNAQDKPLWIGEIKWSDRVMDHEADATKSIKVLLNRHPTIVSAFFTTRTKSGELKGSTYRVPITLNPSALYCYTVGRNITAHMSKQ